MRGRAADPFGWCVKVRPVKGPARHLPEELKANGELNGFVSVLEVTSNEKVARLPWVLDAGGAVDGPESKH